MSEQNLRERTLLADAKAEMGKDQQLFVIVRASQRFYALPIGRVHDMLSTPEVVEIPVVPPSMRGVVNIRGSVLPLIDLRKRLGMQGAEDETAELIAMLKTREQDHRNWLAELESAIRENRDFSLATDPHKCGFGKWYDNYRAPTFMLANHLAKFDDPHKRIHAIAKQAISLKSDEDLEGALDVIRETRDTDLSLMIELFERAYRLFAEDNREITVVLEGKGRSLTGLAVDEVMSVEEVTAADYKRLDHRSEQLTEGMGFLRDKKTVAEFLQIDVLVEEGQQQLDGSHLK
jgi:chemotaxis signal transduction protein